MHGVKLIVFLAAAAFIIGTVAHGRSAGPTRQAAAEALAQHGIIVGAGTTMSDGYTYVIDRMTVKKDGDWIVVRILPRKL